MNNHNHNDTANRADQGQAPKGQEASNEHNEPDSAHNRRRRTLDEELRHAGDHLWNNSDDLEHGTLVAVGDMDNHGGFLARGGAGGEPVFMGVGYVQGVEDHTRGKQPLSSTTRLQ